MSCIFSIDNRLHLLASVLSHTLDVGSLLLGRRDDRYAVGAPVADFNVLDHNIHALRRHLELLRQCLREGRDGFGVVLSVHVANRSRVDVRGRLQQQNAKRKREMFLALEHVAPKDLVRLQKQSVPRR